jgi:hypothetical protein
MEDPESSLAIATRHFDNGEIKVGFITNYPRSLY